MLICPQCKFENPNGNKFCQSCGTSLTHKICHKCGASVVLNAQFCTECGAECGPIWWAIIAQTVPIIGGEEAKTQENAHTGESNLASWPSSRVSVSSSPYVVGSYLDSQHRYQLLADLPDPEAITANIEVKVRVLDCQPYQVSPLAAMLENNPQGLLESLAKNGIPNSAKAYIQLYSEIQPGIPLIHDAWQQNNMQVVLLEDRSNWQSLLDIWQNDTTDPLQILHWCYQMTQLWAILEPVGCRQSLLDLSNLRLDEDQTLALQRLYTDPPANEYVPPITIKALGRVWQTLFRQSQKTQFGLILQMLEELESEKIETLLQLRSRLETIASELATAAIINNPTINTDSAITVLQPRPEEDTINKNDDAPTMVLPMQLSSLEDTGRTDVGKQRHHNEDYFGIETKIHKLEYPRSRVLQAQGLYILCDGMGGHAGGEIASELAVNTLQQYFQQYWLTNQLPTETEIRTAIALANQTIYTLNQQDGRSGVGRMGTTLVMLLLQDNQAAVAHIGDSRLYRLTRKRGLEQITIDHEVGQREISRGVDANLAYARPDAYQLTQALGPRDESAIEPDVEFFEINEDTLLLLASDGLSDNDLLETHWQSHLEPLLSSSSSLELGVSNLIDLANQYNGHDNITAILIRVKVRPNQESCR